MDTEMINKKRAGPETFEGEVMMHKIASRINSLGKMVVIRTYDKEGERKGHYAGMLVYDSFERKIKYDHFTLISSEGHQEVRIPIEESDKANWEWRNAVDFSKRDQFFPVDENGKVPIDKKGNFVPEKVQRISKLTAEMKEKSSSLGGALATYEPDSKELFVYLIPGREEE